METRIEGQGRFDTLKTVAKRLSCGSQSRPRRRGKAGTCTEGWAESPESEPKVSDARLSAGWALVFIAILYTTAPAVAAMARLNFSETIQTNQIGSAEGNLEYKNRPEWFQNWEKTGLLEHRDWNGDGRIQYYNDAGLGAAQLARVTAQAQLSEAKKSSDKDAASQIAKSQTALAEAEKKIADAQAAHTETPFAGYGWKGNEMTTVAKDIIVLANGEKVPPADLEAALLDEPLFDQVLLIGEGRSHLALLAVVEPDAWAALAAELGLDAQDDAALEAPPARDAALGRANQALRDFPGYAKVRHVALLREPWTVENELLTPTQKTRRPRIEAAFAERIEALYGGR